MNHTLYIFKWNKWNEWNKWNTPKQCTKTRYVIQLTCQRDSVNTAVHLIAATHTLTHMQQTWLNRLSGSFDRSNTHCNTHATNMTQSIQRFIWSLQHTPILDDLQIKSTMRGGGLGSSTIFKNLMSPTPRRKWYLTTGRRAH